MSIHRVELRQLTGRNPDLENDPVISTDYTIINSAYSFALGMEEAGVFKFYTVSYDDAGNVSSVSSIITVTVEEKK